MATEMRYYYFFIVVVVVVVVVVDDDVNTTTVTDKAREKRWDEQCAELEKYQNLN